MTRFEARGFSRRRFLAFLLAGALGGGLAASRAAQASADPEAYVSGIADQVMALANSGAAGTNLRGKFAALLNRYINLRAIANYALGTYQSKLPAGKKDTFYQLVSNYAAALFVYYVDDFRGTKLAILSNSTQGKFVVIQSAIVQKRGGREQVRWRLLPDGGGYRVSDVNIKGVWLTIAMKDRFNKVLKSSNGSFDALFDELRSAETW
jgi:ABC-type transporter MlaC component